MKNSKYRVRIMKQKELKKVGDKNKGQRLEDIK